MASSQPTYGFEDGVTCADFIGRDQHVTYGFTTEDVERLIDKVLDFLARGAAFYPDEDANTIKAEMDGESLTFQPGAARRLQAQRSERSYLLGLTIHQEYRVWATKFIPLAARVDVRKKIEGLDMPVAYSEFRLPPPGAGPEAQITKEPLDDITQALEKHKAFVILGDPGAGKTTTLQKIAYEHAVGYLTEKVGRVPLFMRLSQQGDRQPFDFLRAFWEGRTGGDLADALAKGRVLLLLDGINEIPREHRAERLKSWRLFASEFCETNQIVFSGREKDYDGQLGLPRVSVEPMDDPRIHDYLGRNNAEGLIEILDEAGGNLRLMARNPFNLSLLAYAYRANQRDMANRGFLLQWFVGELFSREEKLAHPGWLPRAVQIAALSQMAYAMQEQGESLTLPYETACEALPENVVFRGEPVDIRPAELFKFARAGTILDPNIDPDVRFYHHLLQEYFAALDLQRRFDAGEDLNHLWNAPRLEEEMPVTEVGEWDPLPEPPTTGWEVTTILAAGLANDPVRLIAAVRQVNPMLAGRCLDEAGLFHLSEKQAGELRASIRSDLLADLYSPEVHLRARLQSGLVLGRIGDLRFKETKIDGVKAILPTMVPLPAGDYLIGSPEDDRDAFDNEHPQTKVELPAFRIGKWPVTNAEYACFMAAGGYEREQYWQTDLARRWLAGEDVAGGQFTTWFSIWKQLQDLKEKSDWRTQLEKTGSFTPQVLDSYEYIADLREDELKAELSKSLKHKSRTQPNNWDDPQYNNPTQPVVGVTWFEANAYCAWLADVTCRPYRLPTEPEWEAAARGLPKRGKAKVYPWGDEWDPSRANTLEGRALKPSPVGAYAAAGGLGPFEAEDQSGNVWNWTSSLYLAYPYDAERSEGPEAEGERVVRGGSWFFNRWDARCATRSRNVPDYFLNSLGFRVLLPGSDPES